MKLLRYRVRNFRSVVDSGWLDAGEVTALVGVNESGKTNLLLPLWKLNPARDGEIIPTSDYPKAQYAAIRANPAAYYFIEAEFSCPEIAAELAALTGLPEASADVVSVSMNFEGEYAISFPNFVPKTSAPVSEVQDLLERTITELGSSTALQKEGNLRQDLVDYLSARKQGLAGDLGVADLQRLIVGLRSQLPAEPAPTSTIVPRHQRLIGELEDLVRDLQLPSPGEVEGVEELVTEHLPRFVYYSNYGNLDSEIYLPHVVENLKRTNLGGKEAAKARTLKVLFSFVRLEPEDILELGQEAKDARGQVSDEEIEAAAERKRERTILLNSAGTDLTKKFKTWWKQGDYTFDFQADGDHFRIWVSDSRRPERVELEDRSTGLQWFLSFYLIFLVESEQDHQDAILLLDEPGLSLHPLAQKDLSAFFDNLSKTNQLIYTTHSPFLVDADMLDRARKIYVSEEDGSTKVTADLRRGSGDPRKSGATYAIYSALNMNVAESLLIGCHPVVVEGPSDQHYLTAIKTLLIAAGRLKPSRELIFPPAHGARNAQVIATILSGRDDELPMMLLDGDSAGLKMAKDMKNGLYQAAKERVVDTNPYVGFSDSEIEDLIPFETTVHVIDRWQKNADREFAEVAQTGKPIVPQIEAWAQSEGLQLEEGWKVEVARRVKERLIQKGAKDIDEAVLDRWTKLFDAILA